MACPRFPMGIGTAVGRNRVGLHRVIFRFELLRDPFPLLLSRKNENTHLFLIIKIDKNLEISYLLIY